MRILVAEDDPDFQSVLLRSLRSWGYEAVLATNGLDAWSILKRPDAPRIAVLDWDMPNMTGVEVCRLLRTTPHGPEVYVVMLTGRQMKEDLVSALESGADDFLSKPFYPRELELRLAKGISLQANRVPLKTPPPSGCVLGHKYRLERQIAEGGMASVWLGVHLSLGINVAIKFMKPGVDEVPDYASFESEARAAAQLRSEHILRVYDHGVDAEGASYLVMEYLAGESLAERIERNGPLPPLEVASIVDQIGRGLIEAHRRTIIHRDVKPENVLLLEDPDRPYGLAKLVDFGLARTKTSLANSDTGGIISGTPSYMAPEHLRGRSPPNPHLDMWGLAATAFCALTAMIPFDGDTIGSIVKRVCAEPLPVPSAAVPSLTKDIDAWFAKACARRPDDRFQSVADMTSALWVACASVPRTPSMKPSASRPGFAATVAESLAEVDVVLDET